MGAQSTFGCILSLVCENGRFLQRLPRIRVTQLKSGIRVKVQDRQLLTFALVRG